MNVQTKARVQTDDSSARVIAAESLSLQLEHAAALLTSSLPAGSLLSARLEVLRERLASGRLQLAVLGQFKRGKSTFINALLGAPLLPTAVVPLTAIATFIAWRSAPLVRVRYKDGREPDEFAGENPDAIRDFLFQFVAEEANPENRLAVERVELFCPAPILADGTVLIDTPGIGSTLRHNTEAALRVLPECDAALFVVSADPPITDVELDYLRQVQTKASRIFIILNKIDYLAANEQASMIGFLSRTLRENAIADFPASAIFCVSARSGLDAKQSGKSADLERSGIRAIEEHLLRALAREKSQMLEGAIRGKSAAIVAEAAAELDLRTHALTLPLADLAAKLHAFEEALASIEEQRLTLRDVLSGDQRRFREHVERRVHELRKEISAQLTGIIDGHLSNPIPSSVEDAVGDALSAALVNGFKRAEDQEVRALSAETSAVLTRHQSRIDAISNTIRQTAARIFDVSLGEGWPSASFGLAHEPYWVTDRLNLSLMPDASRLVDRLLPAKVRRAHLRARLAAQAEELVLRNGENLRWALLRGLDETFRTAVGQFEEQLDQAIAATKGIINDAVAQRNNKSFQVDPEVERLRRAKTLLDAFHQQLVSDKTQDQIQVRAAAP